MRAVLPSCRGAAAAPHVVSGGGEGGAAGAAGGEGGGRGLGGWRGGAHAVCGLMRPQGPAPHPPLHEALEGGEVAIHHRPAKSLLHLWA